MNTGYSPSLSSDIIKIFFIKLNLKKKKNNITSILNTGEFYGKKFDSFLGLITKKTTINSFSNYLNNYILLLKINGYDLVKFDTKSIKIILSAFTLKYYSDIMNIDKENEVSKFLLETSNKLIVSIIFLSCLNPLKTKNYIIFKSINDLINKYIQFDKVFTEWKKLDVEAIICNLAKIYIDLEDEFIDISNIKNKNEELFNLTTNNFEIEKKKIINKVKKINKNGEDIFNKYYIFLKHEEELSKSIEKNMEKAYWDIIKTDMLKIPPDYSSIINILKETKILLKECTPNRPDLINEIDNHIEIDILEHYIKQNINLENSIFRIIEFIISKIEEYQAREDDKNFEVFKNDFSILKNQKKITLDEILIFFFKNSMKRLLKIKNVINK
jgi:hypothetical protein